MIHVKSDDECPADWREDGRDSLPRARLQYATRIWSSASVDPGADQAAATASSCSAHELTVPTRAPARRSWYRRKAGPRPGWRCAGTLRVCPFDVACVRRRRQPDVVRRASTPGTLAASRRAAGRRGDFGGQWHGARRSRRDGGRANRRPQRLERYRNHLRYRSVGRRLHVGRPRVARRCPTAAT